ncbi:MAG TPA: hypothetical protein VLB84_21085 [Bacteroidia bacterium]|nr:hypothetical protein [Bacteroidia bacterium]
MKRKDLLEEQFKEFKLSSSKTKNIFGGYYSTTGDTSSGSPEKSDDCDSDNDTTSTGPARPPAGNYGG